LASVLGGQEAGNNLLRDLVRPNHSILETGYLSSPMHEDIGVRVARPKLQVGNDLPSWIILVDDGNHLSVVIGFHNVLHARPEIREDQYR